MPRKYRLAAVGFAHSHIETNLKDFASRKDRVEFVAAADVKPQVPSIREAKKIAESGEIGRLFQERWNRSMTPFGASGMIISE
ncbi:MAG: hypothetical protein LBQ46_02010 [Treponema sp.]|nr:hypothetical protein [Treponema sp.]